MTGYREVEDFGASESNISFGRYFKASTGNFNFVAMDYNTQGELNAPPKVGPIVIKEIMYHPDWPEGGSYNNDDYEYIELHNITVSPVTLYDGPYDGRLSNASERVELSMPGDVDEFGTRYYIRIDRVNYSDGWHPEDCPGGIDLWPIEADGGGKSLVRKVPDDYGNDPDNWEAGDPSPGSNP